MAQGTRIIVTPGSQDILKEAIRAGYVETLMEAGAVVTSSTCGACFGGHMGLLADGEVCITASTRNFKGRMGSPDASVFMGSPATVAASAVTGRDHRSPRRHDDGEHVHRQGVEVRRRHQHGSGDPELRRAPVGRGAAPALLRPTVPGGSTKSSAVAFLIHDMKIAETPG